MAITQPPADGRVYIAVNSAGIGARRGKGKGMVSLFKKADTGEIEIGIGRGPGWGYKQMLQPIWGRLSVAQAHEFAAAIMYLTGKDFPCKGEEPKVKTSHQTNMSINMEVKVDLCRLVGNQDQLEQFVIEEFKRQFKKAIEQLPAKGVANE